jgi:hypothetical protein
MNKSTKGPLLCPSRKSPVVKKSLLSKAQHNNSSIHRPIHMCKGASVQALQIRVLNGCWPSSRIPSTLLLTLTVTEHSDLFLAVQA